jgi:hypothetical protein
LMPQRVPISPQCRMNFCSTGESAFIVSCISVTTEISVTAGFRQAENSNIAAWRRLDYNPKGIVALSQRCEHRAMPGKSRPLSSTLNGKWRSVKAQSFCLPTHLTTQPLAPSARNSCRWHMLCRKHLSTSPSPGGAKENSPGSGCAAAATPGCDPNKSHFFVIRPHERRMTKKHSHARDMISTKQFVICRIAELHSAGPAKSQAAGNFI